MLDRWSTTEGRRIRELCWKRDSATRAACWICGQPIDYAARPSTTPDSWEPDHRATRKDHPELALDPANIMPAHRRCNRARGDGAAFSGLGNRSRKW